MAGLFRRRAASLHRPTVAERLDEAERRSAVMLSGFTRAEFDLVAFQRVPTGTLARPVVASSALGDVTEIRERLAGAGYLRPRDRDQGDIVDGVANAIGAVVVATGEPVYLSGDLALSTSIRAAPGVLGELRSVDLGAGAGFRPVTLYAAGTNPFCVLEEVTDESGALRFQLVSMSRAMIDVYDWIGLEGSPAPEWEGPFDQVVAEAQRQRAEAGSLGEGRLADLLAGSYKASALRVARMQHLDVVTRTVMMGVDDQGWWLGVDSGEEARGERVRPFWLEVALAQYLEPDLRCSALVSVETPADGPPGPSQP
jgi:hypothetical protein